MLVHGKLYDISLHYVNDRLFVLKSPMLQHVLHLHAERLETFKRALVLASREPRDHIVSKPEFEGQAEA